MSNNPKGLLLAFLSSGLFAATLIMAKLAAADFHVLQILLVRQVFVFASTLPVIVGSFPENLKTREPLAHAIRLIGAFVALSAGIWAVAVLPLTTAATLAFSQVFFVAILASKFLAEPVDAQRIAAVLLGFLGVFIAMHPSLDGLMSPYSIIPVAGALGAASAVICVRKLSQSDGTGTLLAYQAIFVGLLSSVPLFWLWKTPTASQWSLLICIGVVATIAQWVGVKALRLGEASLLSQVEYSKLIYAAIFGYLIFSEVPDLHTAIGAIIIVGSSIYIIRRRVPDPVPVPAGTPVQPPA